MADINELKGKFLSGLGVVAEATRDLAEKATDKAKVVSRQVKISTEIKAEKKVIERAYYEIGKLYFESHQDDAEAGYAQLCHEIILAKENVEKLLVELNALKTKEDEDCTCCDDCEDIEVEFIELPHVEDDDFQVEVIVTEVVKEEVKEDEIQE